jgi:hypothetical protein
LSAHVGLQATDSGLGPNALGFDASARVPALTSPSTPVIPINKSSFFIVILLAIHADAT